MIQEGVAVDPFLAGCGMESHDFGQAQLDALPMWGEAPRPCIKRSLIDKKQPACLANFQT
ncbi:hypothetical protein CXF86_20385 [Shewanella sp. GutCb]|nr:hypothetical protein CXF86_20385 [Shewanella sp. GutCb]